MGHKIFVSYKYADDQVANLSGQRNSTVRDYVDELENYFDSSSHIYKGESSGEDLSQLEEETIWSKLRDRIFDSTMTIVFISPEMKVTGVKEKDQWIPWEVSFSLRTTKRKTQSGSTYTSNPNAMLAVVLPDVNGSYDYFHEKKNCCTDGCTTIHTGNTFTILQPGLLSHRTIPHPCRIAFGTRSPWRFWRNCCMTANCPKRTIRPPRLCWLVDIT